jgi:AcrR family transcriptional regulator
MPRYPDDSMTLRQQQAAARREQIIETALKLFAENGFDGTSTKQIARSAGITEGLVFYYFPTKMALLAAVLETHHSFISELRILLADASNRPVLELLPTIARAWLNVLRREESFTRMMLGAAQAEPQVGELLRGLIAEGVERLSAYFAARIEAGELRADLPVETSAMVFFSSLMMFFVVHHTLPNQAWQSQADAFVDGLCSLWFHGAAS